MSCRAKIPRKTTCLLLIKWVTVARSSFSSSVSWLIVVTSSRRVVSGRVDMEGFNSQVACHEKRTVNLLERAGFVGGVAGKAGFLAAQAARPGITDAVRFDHVAPIRALLPQSMGIRPVWSAVLSRLAWGPL